MIYVQAIIALIPLVTQLIGMFVKTPEEKRQAWLAQLPAKLREIDLAFNTAVQNKDPSEISKLINQ